MREARAPQIGESLVTCDEDFAELCKNLFDGFAERHILHVPRHCGFGVPEVFFPSRLTREPIRSVNRIGLALYVNREDARTVDL